MKEAETSEATKWELSQTAATHQISLRGDADQDEIISHSNLLPLWPLLWCRMDGPPACLAYTQTHTNKKTLTKQTLT